LRRAKNESFSKFDTTDGSWPKQDSINNCLVIFFRNGRLRHDTKDINCKLGIVGHCDG